MMINAQLQCFWAVLRYNVGMHDRFRPHYFGFSEYCIARSYQIRENVLVLQVGVFGYIPLLCLPKPGRQAAGSVYCTQRPGTRVLLVP